MSFTPKKISINGKTVSYVQSSLKVKQGYGETTNRVQVSGRSVQLVPSENLETKIAEISFDILVSDFDSDADPRVMVKTWKANIGVNQIIIEPDGVGQTQSYSNASLTNDPDINESPDGVISLTWQSSTVILTD
jgi:hypothetical protein